MPKLNLTIHVDQNGQQTIHSDGDPALWPLVGRLAACHPQAFTVRMPGENTSDRWSSMTAGERLSWGRHNGGVSLTLDGHTTFVTGELAEKLAEALDPRRARDHKINTALVTLGWKGVGDLLAWAEMTRERIQAGATHEAALTDAIGNYGTALIHLGWRSTKQNVMEWARESAADKAALESQVNMVDEVLRPVLTADEGDSILELASIARSELEAARAAELKIRLTIEEAIGRTPDPSRSTEQLAIDLVETLKAAVMRR